MFSMSFIEKAPVFILKGNRSVLVQRDFGPGMNFQDVRSLAIEGVMDRGREELTRANLQEGAK